MSTVMKCRLLFCMIFSLPCLPVLANDRDPFPHTNIVRHTIEQGFDQFPQQGAKARAEISAVKQMLDTKVQELFGPLEPGNEFILKMQKELEDWFSYERFVVCPYLAWPNTSLPTTSDDQKAPNGFFASTEQMKKFEQQWSTKEPQRQSLQSARARILKAYNSLPEPFPFAVDADYPLYVATKHTPRIFNRQLQLELQLRGLSKEQASALFKAAYEFPQEIEEGDKSYFVPASESYWYEYHRRYYRAAATKTTDQLLPDYAHVKIFEEKLAALKMQPFLDRWRKRIKLSLEPRQPNPAHQKAVEAAIRNGKVFLEGKSQ